LWEKNTVILSDGIMRGYHIHVQRIGLHIMVLKLVYIECKLGWITKLIAVKVYNC